MKFLPDSADKLLVSLGGWLQSHPTLGWAILLVYILWTLIYKAIQFLPEFDKFKATILAPFARSRRFLRLSKAARKYDIRGKVNHAVRGLRSELPPEWIHDLEIEWVQQEDRIGFLEDNEIAIRLRPHEDQSRNFANVAYHFLRQCFFPKVKSVIPEVHREAAVLFVSHKVLRNADDKARGLFEDMILEPAIEKKEKILDYYCRYDVIDKRGLFLGPFLREVQDIAERVRLSSERKQMGQELVAVLDHLTTFKEGLDTKEQSFVGMTDDLWTREGVASTYGLLLVAHPDKVVDTWPYVKRARERYGDGVDRLYVLGTSSEKRFFEKVVGDLESKTSYKLAERFVQACDYRGMKDGVGALFVKGR